MKCPHCDRHPEQAARMLTDEEMPPLPEPNLYEGIVLNKNGKYLGTQNGYLQSQISSFTRAAIEAFCKANNIKIGESNG